MKTTKEASDFSLAEIVLNFIHSLIELWTKGAKKFLANQDGMAFWIEGLKKLEKWCGKCVELWNEYVSWF